MVAEQQHDTEHSAEAVPRCALLQLQQPIVLREETDRLRPAPAWGRSLGGGWTAVRAVLLEVGEGQCWMPYLEP